MKRSVGFLAPETMDHHQRLDWEGLKGRLLSSSYIPQESEKGHVEMIRELREIFCQYASDNAIQLDYVAKIYFGRLA